MINFSEFYESLELRNNDKGKQNCVIIMGRFQPFTKGHLSIIEKAYNKYKLPFVVAIVKGAKSSQDKKRNPFEFDMQKKLIEASMKSISNQVVLIKSAFLGEIVDAVRPKYEPVGLVAGSDRVSSYQKQIDKYGEKMNLNLSLIPIQRKEGSSIAGISATKVRNSIIENDIETFKKMMPTGTYKYFEQLRKIMEKNN